MSQKVSWIDPHQGQNRASNDKGDPNHDPDPTLDPEIDQDLDEHEPTPRRSRNSSWRSSDCSVVIESENTLKKQV